MYSQEDFNNINKIILSTIDNIEKLILFGSYSEGKETDRSDIDYAIITNHTINRTNKINILNKLWNKLAKEGHEVDLIIKSLDKYNKQKNVIESLAYTLHQKGRLIWQAIPKKS